MGKEGRRGRKSGGDVKELWSGKEGANKAVTGSVQPR